MTFINICLVFFVSGLTLRTDELKTAFTRRNALGTAFGFASIVGITPLLAFAVRGLPFNPPEYATGLALFCIVPTTVGAASPVFFLLQKAACCRSRRPAALGFALRLRWLGLAVPPRESNSSSSPRPPAAALIVGAWD